MIHDYFCVSFNTQPMNLRRKTTGQRRKSLSKIEPFQGRKQWKEQTTRLNGQKTKQKPWKRMRLAKAMKTMMTEKTRKRDEGYESLEDSSAVSKEFWGLVFVQWQRSTKVLPAEVISPTWRTTVKHTLTKGMALASSVNSGSRTGSQGHQPLTGDWSRKYVTLVFWELWDFVLVYVAIFPFEVA